MKWLVLFIPILVLLSLVLFTTRKDKQPHQNSQGATNESQNINIKASFAIFTNGTFRIFSDSRYHNLSLEVYIDSKNPNILNIKKSKITWSDFFNTLPMKLQKDCLTTGTGQIFCTDSKNSLKFYINKKMDTEALTKEIQAGDKLLISYGGETLEEIDKQFTQIPEPK